MIKKYQSFKNCLAGLDPKNHEKELLNELNYKKIRVLEQFGKLIVIEKPDNNNLKINWTQNIWYNPELQEIKSINDASSILKKHHFQWRFYPYSFIRRCTLIESKLPKCKIPLIIDFPFNFLSSYTLG